LFWWQDLQNKNLAEFKNEINTLSNIEHRNLVRWRGYLEHGDEKIIVVEYVSNGTLREHLDGKLSLSKNLVFVKARYWLFLQNMN